MPMQKIDVIQESPKGFVPNIQLCLQLCRYHFDTELQFGYRFVWKQGDHIILTDKTGIPSVSEMLRLSALAIKEGWGQFSAENKEEIEGYLLAQGVADEELRLSSEEESALRFPIGSFVQRGDSYFKLLSNENDFVGRAFDRCGELVDPFYFDYNGERSQLVTEPLLLAELEQEIDPARQSQTLTRERMEEVGFELNSYPGGNCYELNIKNFDRATEVAELAGIKFDKLSGVHHVILQCNEEFQACFFLCDNDYWEMAPDVFIELIKKLATC